MTALEVCVIGGEGRLASAICQVAEECHARVVINVGSADSSPNSSQNFDVVIDASSPEGSRRATEIAINKGVPLIVCTTGFGNTEKNLFEDASQSIPVILAPNTSPGVSILAELVQIARSKAIDWEVKIEETHHEKKKDKPSGTARFFAEVLQTASSDSGVSVPIHADRIGDITGRHTIIFSTQDEVIRLEHESLDRSLFGRGAIRAAKWLVNRPPGMYTMSDTFT